METPKGDPLDFWKSRRTLILAPAGNKDFPHVRAYKRFCGFVSEIDYFTQIREHGIVATEALIERTVEKERIDLVAVVLFGDSYQFPVELFLRLRRRARIVLWTYDDEHYFHTFSKYYAQTVDAVVTNDFSCIHAYQKMGVPATLNFGWISTEVFYPIDSPRDIDVSFVGNCAKSDRADMIRFLRDNGVAAQAFGPGSAYGWVDDKEISRIYSRTKINLSFTKIDQLTWLTKDDPMLNRVLQNKAAPLQTLATRSFCLSEYAPFLDEYVEIGREVACFHDRDSMLEQIRYFLAHDAEREEMARRGYEKVLSRFTDESFPRLLSELHGMLHPANPYEVRRPTAYIGPRFAVRQVNVLFTHCIYALTCGQVGAALALLPRLYAHGLGMMLAGSIGGLLRSVRLGINRGRPRKPVI